MASLFLFVLNSSSVAGLKDNVISEEGSVLAVRVGSGSFSN